VQAGSTTIQGCSAQGKWKWIEREGQAKRKEVLRLRTRVPAQIEAMPSEREEMQQMQKSVPPKTSTILKDAVPFARGSREGASQTSTGRHNKASEQTDHGDRIRHERSKDDVGTGLE
jgi:hypothetical protein